MKREMSDVWELYTGMAVIFLALSGLTKIAAPLHRVLLCTVIPMLTVSVGARLADHREMPVREAAKRLLIPYAWFSLLLTAAFAATTLLLPDRIPATTAVRQITERIRDTLFLQGSGSLWLFPALFLAIVSIYVLDLVMKRSLRTVLIVLAALIYLILHATQSFYIGGMLEEGGIRGAVIRIFFVLWRAVMTGPFLLWGMWLKGLGAPLKKNRRLGIAAGIGMLALGVLLAWLSKGYNAEWLTLGRPWFSVPAAFLISGGMYFLCDWIGQIRPVNFCGRYAMILYIALSDLGIVRAGEALGEMVFRRFDHNFVTKLTVVLTVVLLSGLAVGILRCPVFSFLFGVGETKDTKTPEEG